MGVMSTIAIISAVVLVAAAGTTAGVYYATEDERKAAKKNELEAQKAAAQNNLKSFNDLKNNLISAKEYLNESTKKFKSGGWVNDDKPLANNETINCINKINTAITNADKIIKKCEDEIIDCDNQINNL